MKFRIGCVVVGFLLFVLSLAAQTSGSSLVSSQVPPLIQFSNVATDEGGNTLSGVVNITFSLYAAQQGGEPLWTETQNNIQLDATGHYSVQLGITKPNGVPTTLFTSGEARWLGVQIAEQEQQPRVLLLSVPYALKAGDAATIGGLPPSAFVLAAPATNAAAVASTTESATEQSASADTATDVTTTGGTADYLPIFNGASTIIDSVLFQSGSGATAKLGVGTITPATTLDVKGAGTIRGTLSLPATGAATATAGKNSQPLKLTASAFNSTSSTAVNQVFQWQSEPASNDTTTPSGTLNLLFGEGATQPSETGLHIASTGQITFATGQTFPGTGTGDGTITGVTAGTDLKGGGTTGTVTLDLDITKVPLLGAANTFTGNQTVTGTLNATSSGSTIVGTTTAASGIGVSGNGVGYGMYGAASSTSGIGVQGNASAATGSTVGVYGSSESTSGSGVQGYVQAASGTTFGVSGISNSPAGYGVYGTNNAATGNAVGVYGATASSTGYGVEGSGPEIGVYGTASSIGYGVYGSAPVTTGTGAGVQGVTQSPSGSGVQGVNFATSGGYGVYGAGTYAVYGTDTSPSGGYVGVYGTSPNGYGVYGTSNDGTGVYGSSAAYGVYGTSNDGFGVYGASTDGTGIYGNSTAYGVYGGGASSLIGVGGAGSYLGVWGAAAGTSNTFDTLSEAAGVAGDTDGTSGEYVGVAATADSNIALLAANNDSSGDHPAMVVENYTTATHNPVFQTSSPNTYSGSRHCTIDTSANLTCTGVLTGIVQQVDGKQTAVYAVQSAENWLEDAGSGTLSSGSVRIELDPAFVQTVNAGVEYHVFLTPKGDCKGLYVTNETATGFEVHELTGGTSSIAFDYRIMAKRKGYENVRLEDVTARFKQPAALPHKARALRPPPPKPQSVPAVATPPMRPLVAPRPVPAAPKLLPITPPRIAQASKPAVNQK